MSIKKMYLKNGIVVYEGTTFEFARAAKFGCVCHENIKAFHEPKSFHPDDAKFQKWKSLLFEQQLKVAGFDIENLKED